MTNYRVRLCLGLALVWLFVASPLWGDASWRAGVASRRITPPGLMWMAGYAHRDHPAEGTLTDLWAKALLLEDAQGERALLITMDLIGIDRALAEQICGQISQRYGLQRAQIAISTSHTHTGPVVAGNLRPMHFYLLDPVQQALVKAYAEQLVEHVMSACDEAARGLEPVELSWGSGAATFAVNRRNNREADVPEHRAAGTLVGPTDHAVPVLAIRTPAGHYRALVFGYACHATTLSSYEWSGDYAGFAQLNLERDYPGCTAMFWAGCGGDQNPVPRREVRLAEQYGYELAGSVKQVLDGTMEPIAPKLVTSYQEIPLPFDVLPTRDELQQQAESSNRYEASRAKMLLQQIDAGQPLSPTYPYPVGVWKLGQEVQWVFLGGEVVVDYAVRLKSELRETRTWVAAYANDVMAYIPSRRVLREGGYEGGGAMVYYGLPTVWAPDVEGLIVDAVHAPLK